MYVAGNLAICRTQVTYRCRVNGLAQQIPGSSTKEHLTIVQKIIVSNPERDSVFFFGSMLVTTNFDIFLYKAYRVGYQCVCFRLLQSVLD